MVIDMFLKLKVKSNSLAAEARIIRKLEHKLRNKLRWERSHSKDVKSSEVQMLDELQVHRRTFIREEARATCLALGFLSNRIYNSIESNRKPEKEVCFQQYIIPKIVYLVKKYGDPQTSKEVILKWINP